MAIWFSPTVHFVFFEVAILLNSGWRSRRSLLSYRYSRTLENYCLWCLFCTRLQAFSFFACPYGVYLAVSHYSTVVLPGYKVVQPGYTERVLRYAINIGVAFFGRMFSEMEGARHLCSFWVVCLSWVLVVFCVSTVYYSRFNRPWILFTCYCCCTVGL